VEEDGLDGEQLVGAGDVEEDWRRRLDGEQPVGTYSLEEDRRAASSQELVARVGAPAWRSRGTGNGGVDQRAEVQQRWQKGGLAAASDLSV
jgi:hypothetical protein